MDLQTMSIRGNCNLGVYLRIFFAEVAFGVPVSPYIPTGFRADPFECFPRVLYAILVVGTIRGKQLHHL